jgi:putative ABC transport system permease protein
MFNNHFKIAWRNLVKYKFISFINLFGLTIGLTSCLLILTYVCYDVSFDKYNVHAGRVYRLTRDFNNENGDVSMKLATIAPAFGYYLPAYFPEIKKMTRLLDMGGVPLRYKDKLFNEQDFFVADENIFDVFSIQVTRGNKKTGLTEPYSVMLSEEIARKYFGSEDPINKIIKSDNQYDLKVTGVYQAFPPNAHLHPGILLSFNTLRRPEIMGDAFLQNNWGNNSFLTYILLPEHYDVNRMISRFPAFIDSHMPHDGRVHSKFSSLHLQKLTDIHLYSHQDNEQEANSDISRVYIFLSISLFVLLIACINYMNLATARSALRAREIGVRKVIGAGRMGLIMQFLGESVIITYVALFLAVALLYLLLPWLNKISGEQLSIGILFQWYILIPLFLTPIVIGIVSGIYPALVISSFKPVNTLKGLIKAGNNVSFQKILVVIQFSISIILMITTVIVYQQMHFLRDRPLGYDRDQMVIVSSAYKFGDRFDAFRNELLSSPDFKQVARSSRVPTGRLLDDMNAYTFTGNSSKQLNTDIKYVTVDNNFIKTYGIHLLAGRDFSKQSGTDSASFILNESALSAIGWKTAQDAIGQPLKYGDTKGQVIGVVKDFNFESMHQQIAPMILKLPVTGQYLNTISIKIDANNASAALTQLETSWKKMLPETPFEFYFLDEKYNALYQSEQRQGTVFTIFSGIAIFIACLGLFGLSAFAILQRTREIAVRKLLGADVGTVTRLLSQNFMKLVLIAGLIACPAAWYAMHLWLENFAYHISIQWWVFGVAGLTALGVAMVTISAQTIKAAVANPVKGLRDQ